MACKICNSQNNYKLNDYNKYQILECNECGIIYSEPFIAADSEWYKEKYSNTGHIKRPESDNPSEIEKGFLKRFKNKTGRILDIGCGCGRFLYYLKKNKFDVYGIDFNTESIKTCLSAGINNASTIDKIDEALLEKYQDFDYVSAIDVLEHLDKPNEFITIANKILKTDGIVFISVPNFERNPDLIDVWVDNPPHHLTKWTEKSLSNFLNINNFEVLECKAKKLSLNEFYMIFKIKLYDKIMEKIKSIKIKEEDNALSKKTSENESTNTIIKKIIINTFKLILIIPYIFFSNIYKLKSDHIFAYARKK